MLDLFSDCRSSEQNRFDEEEWCPKIGSCFREYTGISRQTGAAAPIIVVIMIAKTVLVNLVGSSCEKLMICTAGFTWISSGRTLKYFFPREFVKDSSDCDLTVSYTTWCI